MAQVIRRGKFVDITNIELESFANAPDSKSGKTKILYNQAVKGDDLTVDGIKFSVLGYVKKDQGGMLKDMEEKVVSKK
jgi:hypothetical protein